MNTSGKSVFLADGLEVVRGVRESRPDLVLLDIGMPGLNGIDVIERLRRHGDSPPIIMLSMHSSVEDVARAMAAGANGYLPKESAFDELSQALEELAAVEVDQGAASIPSRSDEPVRKSHAAVPD